MLKINKKSQWFKILQGVLDCVLIAILILLIKRTSNNQKYVSKTSQHQPLGIMELQKKHKVTKALKKTVTDDQLNVMFYDRTTVNNLDLDQIKEQLKVKQLDSVTLLMYSDGCPRCNKEIPKLNRYLIKNSTDSNLIICINASRGIQSLYHKFQIPADFHYPSIFTYRQDMTSDGRLKLIDRQFLDN